MKPMWRKVGASVNHYDVLGIPGCNVRVIRRLDHSGEKRWHVTVTGEGPTMVDKFIMQVDAEKYIDWQENRAWGALEEYDKDLIDFYEKNAGGFAGVLHRRSGSKGFSQEASSHPRAGIERPEHD